MARVGLEQRPVPDTAIDIACGDGALLTAVAQESPCTQILGFDLDSLTVRSLAAQRPGWSITAVDALSAAARSQSHVLGLWGEIDLAVLNPPFSCRGQRTLAPYINNLNVQCSPHMAFTLVAIEALRLGGRLVAILPAGAYTIIRDKKAWSIVQQACSISIGCSFPRGSFPGVAASTEMHVINKARELADPGDASLDTASRCKCVMPVRGWQQIHSLTESSNGIRLVHTSHLANGKIDIDRALRIKTSRSLTAPAVLLPRVGKPNPNKVAVHYGEPIALSDCVFAIPCASEFSAELLRQRIVDSWHVLEARYAGSCAPHLTLTMLRSALCEMQQWSCSDNEEDSVVT